MLSKIKANSMFTARFYLFYKFINCVVQLIQHLGVALFNCVNNTVVKMILKYNLSCVVKG